MALGYILRNCSTFVDGYGLHGSTTKITLAGLTEVGEDHRGGGMDAPIEIALGYEKLESSVESADLDPLIISQWGLKVGTVKPFTHKGYLVGEDGTDRAIEIHQRGRIKALDFGDWAPGEKAALTYSLALLYLKLSIGDEALVEIDLLTGIRNIKGIDQNVGMRNALGML